MPSSILLGPKKRLRTGRSLWSDVHHRANPVLRLNESLKCDVAIVGAGVSGAFMAYELSRYYQNVVILDRRQPGMGSTHASTALLQFEIDTPLIQLTDQIGSARANRAWQSSYRATRALLKMLEDEKFRCGFQERNALYLTGDLLGSRGMESEARARNRAGIPSQFLLRRELKGQFGISRTGAIYSEDAGIVDPVALTYELLARARRRGARIFSPVEVKQAMCGRGGVVLSAGSHFVESKAVIFCTGYEIIPGLPPAGAKVTSSWAAATGPGATYPAWLDRTVVWEAAEPYLYLRTDGAGRLIVGGEDAELDSPSYRAKTLQRKAQQLVVKTRRLFEVEPKWKHVWAGAFGESKDGLPLIGEVPGMQKCFAVMGFGGNGTIYSFIAAKLMPALIKGRATTDAKLFAFR